jgi:hypothetical protein
MGHAICHDQDERRADDYGRGLREKKPVACGKEPGIGPSGEKRAATVCCDLRHWSEKGLVAESAPFNYALTDSTFRVSPGTSLKLSAGFENSLLQRLLPALLVLAAVFILQDCCAI